MYTATTMASAAEAIGMSLLCSASPPDPDFRRDQFAHASGEAVVEMLRRGITVRDILTKEAFENAIAVVKSVGFGSDVFTCTAGVFEIGRTAMDVRHHLRERRRRHPVRRTQGRAGNA
ncbi:Dehydratase family protein [Rhodococcoides kyotonense]|uniref:Dehydratase family protein n=1 Tax=Rhodococcoides kyotonense TaxID=398843 RepID=A0A239N3T2_9NOCA|nr:Dehydratase family protein [Rhodococcus kyotonensis]